MVRGISKMEPQYKEDRRKLLELTQNTKQRHKKIRKFQWSGTYDVDFQFLLNLLTKNEMRCEMTGLCLNLNKNDDLSASLERKDTKKTYCKSNLCFVTSRFNNVAGEAGWDGTTAQWTSEKFLHVLNHHFHPAQNTEFFLNFGPQRKRKIFAEPRKINGTYRCVSCEEWKLAEDFHYSSKDPYRIQRVCISCVQTSYAATQSPNAFFKKLATTARKNAKRRLKNGRTEAGEFKIDWRDVQTLYVEQHGLCAVSDMPLLLKQGAWMCSLNRIDDDFGYVPQNVELVCYEFNTVAKWSRSFLQNLIHFYRENNRC